MVFRLTPTIEADSTSGGQFNFWANIYKIVASYPRFFQHENIYWVMSSLFCLKKRPVNTTMALAMTD